MNPFNSGYPPEMNPFNTRENPEMKLFIERSEMQRRILLCDDELHILRAAEFKFKRAGFDVRCANDGQEAWEMIQGDAPDVLITDCQMPRMDGITLAKMVAQTPATAGIPVLMLTAKGFELSQSEVCAKYNVRGVMSKPFSPRELVNKVEELLEKTPARMS